MINELVINISVEMENCSIIPKKGTTINEQLDNCYLQLSQYLETHNLKKSNIIKQTIFTSDTENVGFLKNKKLILDFSRKFFNVFIPTCIVPQPPLNNALVAFEISIIPEGEHAEIIRKKIGNLEYIVVQTTKSTQIIACGLGSEKETTDIYLQSIDAFEQMHNILLVENMDFSNVVRQWNYIENIIGYSSNNQHYQIFNDVRSAFYGQSHFRHGYPAATGIGMETGGVIIDFIALREKSNTSVNPLKSPVQNDAHQYSREVLAHNEKDQVAAETTPKFERAKAIVTNNKCFIYVSGTAAIKGQHSFSSNDVSAQTRLTLDNIIQLVSIENLKNNNINFLSSNLTPSYLRVYIKNISDYFKVKDICESYVENIPVIYLKADICRPELLVEIEGMFFSEF